VKTFAFSLSASEQKDGSLECIQQSSKLGFLFHLFSYADLRHVHFVVSVLFTVAVICLFFSIKYFCHFISYFASCA